MLFARKVSARKFKSTDARAFDADHKALVVADVSVSRGASVV